MERVLLRNPALAASGGELLVAPESPLSARQYSYIEPVIVDTRMFGVYMRVSAGPQVEPTGDAACSMALTAV